MTLSRFFLAGVTVVTLLSTHVVQVRAQDDDPYVPAQVVLRLNSASDLAAVTGAFNLTVIDQFGSRPIYQLRIDDGALPPAKAEALRLDSRVLYAEPNYIGTIPEGIGRKDPWVIGGGSSGAGSQWATGALRLNEAHAVSRGAGATVAVIDTGIDPTHPDFAGRLVAGYDFVNDDSDPREEGSRANFGYGHGTHVAGLIALAAPEANIMPIRALDPDGNGNLWVLAEALVFALDPDGNPATPDSVDVINLSLGTLRETDLLEDLIDDATCSDDDDVENQDRCNQTGGTVVVAAAGNLGTETPMYPAAEQVTGLLSVAASGANRQLASFSSRGPWVNVAAPGEQIVSAVPGGQQATWNGTSMAAPFVAGGAALLRSQNQTATASEVAQTLSTATSPLCGTTLRAIDLAAALGASPTPDAPRCRLHLTQLNR
jgi:subtilisin family serine protease